jgi:hypothetical protein
MQKDPSIPTRSHSSFAGEPAAGWLSTRLGSQWRASRNSERSVSSNECSNKVSIWLMMGISARAAFTSVCSVSPSRRGRTRRRMPGFAWQYNLLQRLVRTCYCVLAFNSVAENFMLHAHCKAARCAVRPRPRAGIHRKLQATLSASAHYNYLHTIRNDATLTHGFADDEGCYLAHAA